MSAPIRGYGVAIEIDGQVFNASMREWTPEELQEMQRQLQTGQLVTLGDAMRIIDPAPIIAAERIAPGLPIAFDAAGCAYRWQPVEPIHFADEPIEPGDALTVLPDGRVRLADRAEASRRAERAEAPPAAGGDVSPGSAGDGPDTAIIARAEP